MAVGNRIDPYRNCNFLVEIDGITRAGFQECSGLDSSQDPVEYREGNEGPTKRKIPGMVKYSNLTLKRGITDDVELWEWRKKATKGTVERKNGSIILLSETGEEKIRWNFREAWPSKWAGPTFNATGGEIAIEQLEISHEGMEKA